MVELVFVTSNNEKLAHIRYLSREYDVFISKQKYYGKGYNEPRVRDRKELFEKSIQDARRRLFKNISSDDKIFFIEDTSVNIPALAEVDEEFPGLEIKYWMKQNNFYSLDTQLKNVNNNRRAIVRSDVALVLPRNIEKSLHEPNQIFTSQIEGTITEEEISITSQPYFCWLNDKTFNKWFIPNSCQLPLSALPISIADKFDFRKGSISNMLRFLEKLGIIKKKSTYAYNNIQLSFLLSPIFIITGPTCAGKTTIAEYLVNEFNYYHLEASDFMHNTYREHHGTNSTILIGDFAERALLVDPGVVVDQINRNIKQHPGIPKVITGLRSPSEIDEFVKKYDKEFPVEIVYVEASFDNRFNRNRKRNRDKINIIKDKFVQLDEQQQRMGLGNILSIYRDCVIENNSTKNNYYSAFLSKYGEKISRHPDINIQIKKNDYKNIGQGLEDVIILALSREGNSKYYTTTQIAHLIKKQFPDSSKNKNNISRYFNQNYYAYYDVIREKGKNMYRLSQTGLSKAHLLETMFNRKDK